jgi:hypothetical protein
MRSWPHRHPAHDTTWSPRCHHSLGLIDDFGSLRATQTADSSRPERFRLLEIIGNYDDSISFLVISDFELSYAKLPVRCEIEFRLGISHLIPSARAGQLIQQLFQRTTERIDLDFFHPEDRCFVPRRYEQAESALTWLSQRFHVRPPHIDWENLPAF